MPKNSSEEFPESYESLLQGKVAVLKDLFSSQGWLTLQEEVGPLRLILLERASETNSLEEANRYLIMAKTLKLFLDDTLEQGALQEAGCQNLDNEPEVQHYMALDSADERQAKTTKEKLGAH